MFVIISGVSGSGKQTIIDAMMKKFHPSEFVKSATTREKRNGETAHYFYTLDKFNKLLEKGEFFESENVHGNMYGILNKDLQRVIENPDIIFFKDVDVRGTKNLTKFLKGKANVVTIFLEVPDEILFKRLLSRGESEDRAKTRLSRGEMERKYKDCYDYVIENLDLEKTIAKVEQIIKKHQN